MRDLEKLIHKAGHAVVMTSTTSRGGVQTGLAYTVGLSDDGLPELVTFGLPAEVARSLLNEAARRLRDDKLQSEVPSKDFGPLPLFFRKVPADRTSGYLNVANDRAGRKVEALQMVWPDRGGKFPWEPGFDEAFRPHQPMLFATHSLTAEPPGPNPQDTDPLSQAQRERIQTARSATENLIAKQKKPSRK